MPLSFSLFPAHRFRRARRTETNSVRRGTKHGVCVETVTSGHMDMLLPPEADRSPLLLSMLAIVCGCANAAVVPDSKSAPNRARQEDESVKPPTTTSAPSSTPRDYYPRRPASLVVTEQPPVMVKRTQRLRVTLLVVGIPETDLGSMVVFMRMHDGTKDCDVSHLMCGPRIVDVRSVAFSEQRRQSLRLQTHVRRSPIQPAYHFGP